MLTAIVITMGLAAFFLALTYRAFVNSSAEDVEDDEESRAVGRRTALDSDDERDETGRARPRETPDASRPTRPPRLATTPRTRVGDPDAGTAADS